MKKVTMILVILAMLAILMCGVFACGGQKIPPDTAPDITDTAPDITEPTPDTENTPPAITEHTVTFISSNMLGSQYSRTEKVAKGKALTESQLDPKATTYMKNTCLFKGWFEDENHTIQFTLTTPITADITLYGGYIEKNDAILEYINYYMDYYEYLVSGEFAFYNTTAYKNWIYAPVFSEMGMNIAVSCVRNIYDVDGTGKDSIFIKITTAVGVEFQWNIIKGNGSTFIKLSGKVAQYLDFHNCFIKYDLNEVSAWQVTDYYKGSFAIDYVTGETNSDISLAHKFVNDVLLKNIADHYKWKYWQ